MTEMATSRQTGWMADDSTFGARLALVRQRMGWGNVKEAAVACGLPAESWRRWERDGRAPRDKVEIAQVIADRTGCDDVWLAMGRREGRIITTAGSGLAHNHGSGRPAKRRMEKRSPRHPHLIGRTHSSPASPTPAEPPSHRRPAMISTAG